MWIAYKVSLPLTEKWEQTIPKFYFCIRAPTFSTHTHPRFLLSKFTSRIGLIQSAMGVSCWSRGPGVSFPGSWVSRSRVSGCRFRAPGVGVLVLGSWVPGSRFPNPGSQILILDYAAVLLDPQSFTGYLRLNPVFVCISALREGFNFCFSRLFCYYWQNFNFAGGLGTRLLFFGVLGFFWFFLIS